MIEQQPTLGYQGATPEPTREHPPIAETWHTLALGGAILFWFYFGTIRAKLFLVGPSLHHVPQYLRMMAFDCGLVIFAVWGVHRAGGSLQTLLGREWHSAKDVVRDIGIAAAFWILSIILMGILRAVLPAAPLAPAPAPPAPAASSPKTESPPAPVAPRFPDIAKRAKIPAVLIRLAPHGMKEIFLWLWLCLTVGFCEEIVFRGYFQKQFAAWLGMPLGVFFSSLIFGLGHLYQGRNSAIVICFYGLLLALLALERKSLLPGILAHSWQDTVSGLLLSLLRR